MLDKISYDSPDLAAFMSRKLERKADTGKVESVVAEIVATVRAERDSALVKYTQRFDYPNMQVANLAVAPERLQRALAELDPDFRRILEGAAANIRDFAQRQLPNSWFDRRDDGSIVGQQITAIDSVGIYVPGGLAPLFSTVLMNAIPAKVAGVSQIIMATPPNKSGEISADILAAAALVGVDHVYALGGAQAIAAMAYGTETVPAVKKIVGPGNIYVAVAKRQVYGHVGIDMFAGPSEVLVVADASANPEFIAADLLSQAEHDPLASAILVATSDDIIAATCRALAAKTAQSERQEIIRKSLSTYSFAVSVPDLDAAYDVVNRVAPEHLELQIAEPFAALGKIKHAGAIFLGSYTPEAVGDYWAGPNHVLPTGGSAAFSGSLSVLDFVKHSSVLYYPKSALLGCAEAVAKMANREQLVEHRDSVRIRMAGSS